MTVPKWAACLQRRFNIAQNYIIRQAENVLFKRKLCLSNFRLSPVCKESSLFLDVTDTKLVVSYPNDVSGQPIGPSFKGQAVQEDPWKWDPQLVWWNQRDVFFIQFIKN
jgi:hypothetical protein